MRSILWCSLLLVCSVLCLGCPSPGDNSGGGFNVGGPSDDDDDGNTEGFEEGEVSGYVEFIRRSDFGSGAAQVSLLSSWFVPMEVEPRLPLPSDSDSCHSGETESDLYGIPGTSIDIGTPSLISPGGATLDMELDAGGQYWVSFPEVDDWESHQEYEVVVSGGEDRPEGKYPGALATPAALTLTSLEEDDLGLSLEWYGGNNNGHVGLRMVQESQDSPGMDLWVVCRLHDDGEATISAEDLATLGVAATSLELMRSTSANFEPDVGAPGVASGIATAKATWTPSSSER